VATKKNTKKKLKPKAKKNSNNSTVSRTLAADTSGLLLAENSSCAGQGYSEATPRVDNSHDWHQPVHTAFYTAEHLKKECDTAYLAGKMTTGNQYWIGVLQSSLMWIALIGLYFIFR